MQLQSRHRWFVLPVSRKHKALIVSVAGVVVLLFVFAIWGDSGWTRLRDLRRQQTKLEADACRIEHENARMREHLARLESDNEYLEKVVRERLGWIKPGEILYRLNIPGTSADPVAREALSRNVPPPATRNSAHPPGEQR